MSDGDVILRELLAHPLLNGAAPDRIAFTLRDAETVPASERFAGGIAAIRSVHDWKRAESLVRQLGNLRYAPATPSLIRLWQKCPVTPVRNQAGHALFAIGSSEALEALRATIDDHEHISTFLGIKATILGEPDTAFERLEPYFTEDALRDKPRRAVASAILFFFGPSSQTPEGGGKWKPSWHDETIPGLLRSYPEWIRLAILFREDRRLGISARHLLSTLTPEEVEAALQRWPDPPKIHGVIPSGRRDYLVRYESGEYEQVWRELMALGPLENSDLRAEVEAVARATMVRVRRNVESITGRLIAADYPFENFRPPWTPPASDVEQALRKIESAAGGPLPVSLRAFWSVIGEVHWVFDVERENVSGPWGDDFPLAEADPLCVYGPEVADYSVKGWKTSRIGRHNAVVGPLFVDLAPDFYHKANISGGAPYTMRIPDESADGYFENEAHDLRFVEYLRLCLWWGGFSRAGDMRVSGAALNFIEDLKTGLEPF